MEEKLEKSRKKMCRMDKKRRGVSQMARLVPKTVGIPVIKCLTAISKLCKRRRASHLQAKRSSLAVGSPAF